MDITHFKQSTLADKPPVGFCAQFMAHWRSGWIQAVILATAVGLATLYALFGVQTR